MVADFSIEEWFESRSSLLDAFLQRRGWAGTPLMPVGEDCGFRRYFRLQKDNKSVLLMEAVPDGHPNATQGHRMDDFVRLSAYLRDIGLHAPEVYDVDYEQGYMLLEDFGDTSFKLALDGGMDRDEIYALATDALLHLYQRSSQKDVALDEFKGSYLDKAKQRIVEWYLPVYTQSKTDPALVDEYNKIWDDLAATLPPCPQGFVHADFHFENLMWVDGEEGLSRVGVLDYQGALKGALAYDLGNLLEDARVDVPEDLRQRMLARFCAGMSAEEEQTFRAWYRFYATQFHCRLMGQFVRLAVNDKKPRYLQFLPRVAGYLREGLKDPLMTPLADWLKAQGLVFDDVPEFDHIAAAQYINDGAY